jgi:hypothetical protein
MSLTYFEQQQAALFPGQPTPPRSLPRTRKAAITNNSPHPKKILPTIAHSHLELQGVHGFSPYGRDIDCNEHGRVSRDRAIASDPSALMSYMAQQNTRPAFFLHVYGWHTETTKTTKIKKQNGSTVSKHSKHTETSTLQVTDWEYFIDLTPYIKPVGFIRAERNGESVPLCQCLKGFTECAKASKRLEMVKYIGEWNTKGLEKRITEHLKETQGRELSPGTFNPAYNGKFSVKFEILQDQVKYIQEGLCEACLMSNSCRIFLTPTCCCTCYCCWAWHFLEKYGEGGYNGLLKSEFRVDMDEDAFFEAAKPALLMGSLPTCATSTQLSPL